jgi:hypothetical protein
MRVRRVLMNVLFLRVHRATRIVVFDREATTNLALSLKPKWHPVRFKMCCALQHILCASTYLWRNTMFVALLAGKGKIIVYNWTV